MDTFNILFVTLFLFFFLKSSQTVQPLVPAKPAFAPIHSMGRYTCQIHMYSTSYI
jgi:hypothetical protein